MYVPKSFVEIVSGMIAHMQATQRSVTDFHIGSVARTLVEAPAVEMDELYQTMSQWVEDAIPVSMYDAFGFTQLPPASAGGMVRISTQTGLVDQPIPIPAGTVFTRENPTVQYQTLADTTIPHGADHVDALLVAIQPGSTGNAPVGAMLGIGSGGIGQLTAVTIGRLVGGTDGETPDEQKARFVDYIESLSHGTVRSLLYAVKQAVVKDTNGVVIETVSRVGITEGGGTVALYLYGSHGAPSAELIASAQTIVDGEKTDERVVVGYRPAGVRVDVLPMIEQLVPVDFKVRMFSGYTGNSSVIDAIKTSTAAAIAAIRPGDVLYVEALIDAALAVPGVQRVICESNSNLLCASNVALALGDVTVEWLSNA